MTILSNMLNLVTVLPVTLEIAIAAPELALPHGGQFDSAITATAKVHRFQLIPRDANIGASSEISTIW